METSNNRLLRDKEVAKKLSIGRTTVWRWAKEGKLPKPAKIAGKTSVWLEADIEAFIKLHFKAA